MAKQPRQKARADPAASVAGCSVTVQKLQSDPFSGTLFVFVNKFRQALRVMTYDGQRFWLCHKRLSKDREDFSGAAFRILFKTGHCKYLPHEPAEYLRFGRRKLQQN